MCLVASFPEPRADILETSVTYSRWLHLVLVWLQGQYGAHLAGVVEHDDETYFHIHAFVLPPLMSDGQLQWEAVHPGRRAKKAAAESGANARGQDAAYVAAMEEFQESFHRSVSSHFGHARFNAKRERRPRPEHLKIRTLEAENEALTARFSILEQQLMPLATPLSPVDDTLLQTFGSDETVQLSQDIDDRIRWDADENHYQAENAAESAEAVDWIEADEPNLDELDTGEDQVEQEWEEGADLPEDMRDDPDGVQG